jgi:mRNA-degrading endonuclease RelE of RelBE toxin-antitoxin system
MAFHISITADAESQWRALSARQQRLLETAIQTRLVHQPTTPTKAVKKLRPNPFAEFELRVGDLRALYNVGKEFHGHQDDPSESAGDEPPGDVG